MPCSSPCVSIDCIADSFSSPVPPLPASRAYRQSRQLTIPMPILQPCVLTVVTAVHAIPWLDHGLQPCVLTIASRSGVSGLPGCPLRLLAVSRFRHHLPAVVGLGAHGRRWPGWSFSSGCWTSALEPTGDVVAAASGPGRWSPGCLRPPWRRPGSTAFKIVFSRAIL